MEKKIKNLFNKEEVLVLNLKNAHHQVKLYLQKLDRIRNKAIVKGVEEQALWYKKVFEYYLNDLIPAIQEIAAIEMKHIEIAKRNPDPALAILEIEIRGHQELTHQFLDRFQQIHRDFYEFMVTTRQ